jgi:hypothetical protein
MVYNLLSVRSSFNKCSPSAFDNFYNATTIPSSSPLFTRHKKTRTQITFFMICVLSRGRTTTWGASCVQLFPSLSSSPSPSNSFLNQQPVPSTPTGWPVIEAVPLSPLHHPPLVHCQPSSTIEDVCPPPNSTAATTATVHAHKGCVYGGRTVTPYSRGHALLAHKGFCLSREMNMPQDYNLRDRTSWNN